MFSATVLELTLIRAIAQCQVNGNTADEAVAAISAALGELGIDIAGMVVDATEEGPRIAFSGEVRLKTTDVIKEMTTIRSESQT